MSGKLTVILADGDFPQHVYPLTLLEQAERIVCCDGAALSLLFRGREPDLVVGDLDSLPQELKAKLAGKIVHYAEQESNDLSKAFRCCMEMGWRNITILGATGKREDHTLGNLSLLAEYHKQAAGIRLVTDHGIFTVAEGAVKYDSTPGQQISLIAIDPDTRVTSEGLKYPLNDLALSMWWQGTLNEALQESFSLQITPGHRLLVFQNFL